MIQRTSRAAVAKLHEIRTECIPNNCVSAKWLKKLLLVQTQTEKCSVHVEQKKRKEKKGDTYSRPIWAISISMHPALIF